MPGYYMATHKYDATESWWDDFWLWRGLPQLIEVVSIENALPFDDRKLTAEDWKNVAFREEVGCGGVFCFRELEPLVHCLLRLSGDKSINLLWVCREPIEQPLPPTSPLTFEFLGCDLIDDETRISALTNCGLGFPGAFAEEEISQQGLIRTLERARQVQADLRKKYPNDPHAQCSLWAIFRSLESRPAQMLDKLTS
jgi:hypothetical protein